MEQHDPSAAVVAAMAAYGLFIFLAVVVAVVISLIVHWRIAAKAGYNGALSLLMLIPLVNILILLVFAFSEWPIEQQLKAARGGGGGLGGSTTWQPGASNPPSTL